MPPKLKTVPQKTRFDDYISKFKYKGDARHIIAAYSDCLEDHIDVEGIERNLKYMSLESLSIKDATEILSLAIPNGYNDFEVKTCLPSIATIFGDDARIFIARESSVCLYIKPASRIWMSRDEKLNSLADEVSFESDLGLFRVWWD